MVKTHTSSRQPTNTRINTVANVLPKERRVQIHIGFPSPRVLHHKDKSAEHDAFFFFLIYLFMVVLGLRFCARAFSSCSKRGPIFIAVRGPLTIAASLVVEHRHQTHRLSNYGSRAQLLCGMWDLPRTGLEPVSPALAGRLSTTAPPGKPRT